MDFKDKKIDLFGSIWTIKYVDSIQDAEDNEIFGLTSSSTRTIIIAKSIEGKSIPKNEVQLTLLHELIHAVFITGQYMRENEDEPLVEWTARCLNQLLKKNII